MLFISAHSLADAIDIGAPNCPGCWTRLAWTNFEPCRFVALVAEVFLQGCLA